MSSKKIIILRFSAMGDVAMVASVLRELVAQNPTKEIVMVSRKLFKPFFNDIPHLIFHAIEPKKQHKGIFGLYKLYKELASYKPIAIADLHDNLRSRIISSFFRLSGICIRRIDKGRKEKAEITRLHNKILRPLKLTVERYADVFRNLGLSLKLSHKLQKNKKQLPLNASKLFANSSKQYIGISPFAQHSYKVYSLAKMEIVVSELAHLGYHIFLFGGGKSEEEVAQDWENKFKNVHNLIGEFSLTEELEIISNLDVMLSMDSAGMHMASLMGVPVVSIWGPTHPYAGFLGYGQSISDCIQIDHPNRPNSIYGNKPCLCGVNSCIDIIDYQLIINKLQEKISNA